MDQVTNRQLYDAIQIVEGKIDNLADKRIRPLERSLDRIYIYGGFAVAVIGIVVDLAVTWIKNKFI